MDKHIGKIREDVIGVRNFPPKALYTPHQKRNQSMHISTAIPAGQ